MSGKRLKPGDEHYVNNKEFSIAVGKYANKYREAKEQGVDIPKMSNYIGQCIYNIATRLANRPNFINYSYRDEMICDGIENTVRYLHNFNYERVIDNGGIPNAFAYVTQIVKNAFLRRIDAEKQQQCIKEKNIEMSGIFNTHMSMQGSDSRSFNNQFNSTMGTSGSSGLNNLDYVEQKKLKNKKKSTDEDSDSE